MQLIVWCLIIVGSVILDQLTKYWAVKDLMPIGSTVVLDKILGLRYVENTGAAFGMLKGQRWFFIVLSSVAILAIVIYLVTQRRSVPPLLGVAMAMIAGGGIGNQIDRILNGFVVDFFEFLFVDFAVFNVADCFVTVGAALVFLDLLFIDRDFFIGTPKAQKKEEAPSSEPEIPAEGSSSDTPSEGDVS